MPNLTNRHYRRAPRFFDLFSARVQFVLFEFRPPLASYAARSPLSHSNGYASADDRTDCLATDGLNLEPFMKYAGERAMATWIGPTPRPIPGYG